MNTSQIRPGFWRLGVSEKNLRVFGPVSFTESGMMYNSWLMDTGDGFLAAGTLPPQYTREWLQAIQDLSCDNLRWMVLFGADSDRPALNALIRVFPHLTVIGSINTLFKLDGFIESPYQKIEIRNTRRLTLGTTPFRFQIIADKYDTPSLYVTAENSRALITADAFGSLYADEEILLSRITDQEAYFRGVKAYFADIFGPRRQEAMRAASLLVSSQDIRLICPSCGPAIDCHLDHILELYQLVVTAPASVPKVVILYSPNGYIEEIAGLIETGILDSGSINVSRCNLSTVNRDDVLRELYQADAFLFGTPDVKGDAAKPVWDIVTSLRAEDCVSKPAAVFTTFSVVGNAADNLRGRLFSLGCNLSLPDFSIQGRPSPQDLKNAYEYGFGTGCSVLQIPNPHKPSLVKCLVCGEIFDASLGMCPVCGVGLDQCVPVSEDEFVYQVSTEFQYVFIGGGIGAVAAAESIRMRDKTGTITMLSAEPYLPVNRPMLTKDLDAAAKDPSELAIHDQSWYDERDIQFHSNTVVDSIDTDKKALVTASNQVFQYDKLIYAAGAECFIPPFPGVDKKGVLTIRHLSDSKALKDLMHHAENAVVIGGGVLGLEAANELMRAGIKVTVLEAASQIIGRQADSETAALIKEKMERLQVHCRENVVVTEIKGSDFVTGVEIQGGEVFPADLVVISCGNRANVSLAQKAGIEVQRAVVVNQYMETNIPDIFACGDCCQYDNTNYQLWQEASEQGRIAGSSAAGDRIAYANTPLALSLEGFGTSLYAIGDAGKKELPYQTVEITDHVSGSCEKYWFFGGSLEGAVLIGRPDKTADVNAAVLTHARHNELF